MATTYLNTKKFYSIPNYAEYHQAKNNYIAGLIPDYANQTIQEKWSSLIANFSESLTIFFQSLEGNRLIKTKPITYEIIQITLEDYQNLLTDFKTIREATYLNSNNLSLKQCINYFEDFCFLYNTTDHNYKLSDNAKKDLLLSIYDCMGVCETGINGRFYSTLQTYQKENDWIANELVKARCETLRILHGQYNAHNDVHDYNHLVTLANKALLGIPKQETIEDAHARFWVLPALQDFFNKQYPVMFSCYEKATADNLTNHYLSELASTLGIDSALWDKGPLTIEFKKTIDIDASLTSYFQGVTTNTLLYELGELSEDGLFYVLNAKQEVAKLIKPLVAKKLAAEHYMISLDELAENPRLQTELMLLHPQIAINDVLQLYKIIKTNDPHQIRSELQKNPLTLVYYPDLIINEIESNPQILSILPAWLKADTRFVDSAMIRLNHLLIEAINENNEANIHELLEQIFNLIGSEYGYLESISKPVFSNRIVADYLRKKDSSLQTYLKEPLQEVSLFGVYFKETTSESFSEQVLSAFMQARRCLPYEFIDEPNFQVNITINITNFLQIKAFMALLSPHHLTERELFAHVYDLNPDLLLKIIDYRKTHQLPPLPFFDKPNTYDNLKKFDEDIRNHLNIEWDKPYLSIKRRACEDENFAFLRNIYSKKTAVSFLARTDNWFVGFNQYHVYQTSHWIILFEKLAKLIHGLQTIGLSILALLLIASSVYYLFPIASAIVDVYNGSILFFTLWCYLSRALIPDGTFRFTLDIVILLINLDATILALGVLASAYSVYCGALGLADVLDFTLTALWSAFNSLAYLVTKNEYSAQTLEDTCENAVIRLQGINQISSQEKSQLLKTLLIQIKAELASEEPLSFKELLNKPYPIEHKGKEYTMSFLEVSSKRRAQTSEFKLDDKPATFGFFSSRTSTNALLESIEAVGAPTHA